MLVGSDFMTNLKTRRRSHIQLPQRRKLTRSPISVIRTTRMRRGEDRLLGAFAQAVPSTLPGWLGGWQAAHCGAWAAPRVKGQCQLRGLPLGRRLA